MRDIDFLRKQAADRGRSIGAYASALLKGPRTRMPERVQSASAASEGAAPRADVIPIARYQRDPKRCALAKPSSRRQIRELLNEPASLRFDGGELRRLIAIDLLIVGE